MSKEKIKILRVVTQAEVVPWHLKNFIERSETGYEVFVVGNDVTRYKNEFPYVIFIDIKIIRKLSLFQDLVALVQLIKICFKIRPQIVHSIMPKAGLLAPLAGLIAGVPVRIHTFTGQVWNIMTGKRRTFYRFIDKVIVSLCTHCLTDSPSQSDFLNKNGIRKNNLPIGYLGKGSLSGVSIKRFDIDLLNKKNGFRKELGIEIDDFVYIYLARKSLTKGIKETFESFAKVAHLPNVKLLFIGPDESDGYLDKLYEKYKNFTNKIIALDIVKEHEKYLSVADVLCLPSNSEGFGTIVIEAATLGVPTIGFDIVGLKDSIEHNYSGILVEPRNTNEFANAMLNLYYNGEKLKEMKVNARKRALQYFSADVMYDCYDEFYKELLLGNENINYRC